MKSALQRSPRTALWCAADTGGNPEPTVKSGIKRIGRSDTGMLIFGFPVTKTLYPPPRPAVHHWEYQGMNLLFIGDVVGKGGRAAVNALVPELRRKYNAQFVIINGENAAAGNGLSESCVTELLKSADVITSGDHTWDQKGFENEIKRFDRVIRPANFRADQPGRGWGVFPNPASGSVAVISLCGKVFMKESAYCPFETMEKLLREIPSNVKTIVVDFHAEATSEKIAMAEFLDGKVTAVFGTHTHVQTADARVLAGGTAAVTDVGMVGADHSVLGRTVDSVVKKFVTGMPVRLPVQETGKIRLDGAVLTYDHTTGRASGCQTFSEYITL